MDLFDPKAAIDRVRNLPGGIVSIAREASSVSIELARIGWVVSDPENVVTALRMIRQLVGLAHPDRPLGKFLAKEGGLEAALAPGGTLDRVLGEEGGIEALLGPDGLLDRAVAPGGTLDQVKAVEETLEVLAPMLKELAPKIQSMMDYGSVLKDSPLGDFAGGILAQQQRRRRRSGTRSGSSGRQVIDVTAESEAVTLPDKIDRPIDTDEQGE